VDVLLVVVEYVHDVVGMDDVDGGDVVMDYVGGGDVGMDCDDDDVEVIEIEIENGVFFSVRKMMNDYK
jgi:hypothetical protein